LVNDLLANLRRHNPINHGFHGKNKTLTFLGYRAVTTPQSFAELRDVIL